MDKMLMTAFMKEKYAYLLLLWFFIIYLAFILAEPSHWAQYLLFCSILYLGIMCILAKWVGKVASSIRSHYNIHNPALQIANETLPLLRRGFNAETAQKVAEIILRISDVSAVAITDREKILAFIGTGCESHPPGMPILTKATQDAIDTGQQVIVKSKSGVNCKRKDCVCPLEAAVVIPLTIDQQVVGTLKLYQTTKGEMPKHVVKMAGGIARLLSMQIEIAQLDHQAQLVTEAQLDALQAQINPHFLFNTLNTIGMFIRTNPNTANKLLHRLASFFRHSLRRTGRFTTLEEEMKFVRNYLLLEKARFRQKLRVVKKIDKTLRQQEIPVLSIQPLVENAIKHGITPKEGKGTVYIVARRYDDCEIEIVISDDGVGIQPDVLERVLEPGYGSGSGVGLSNVHERLIMLYPDHRGLQITSEPDVGTTVSFRIPLRTNNGVRSKENDAKSLDR